MIERRKLLTGAAAVAASTMIARSAQGFERCKPYGQGQMCEAGIEIKQVTQAIQEESQWCWAASISMVFASYGYDVDQERIVKEAYGSPVNMGAVGTTITQQLNRTWIDDSGKKFKVQIEGLYDFDMNFVGITDPQIVNALKAERPLLFGNRSHAMMLFQVAYFPTQLGPRLFNLGFADPWPGMGLRPPRPFEATPMHQHPQGGMRYLALPKVSAA